MKRSRGGRQKIPAVVLAGLSLASSGARSAEPAGKQWQVHDMSRPQPKVVAPGEPSIQSKAGTAPSDAIVLFDGKGLAKWVGAKGEPARWSVREGCMEVARKAGAIRTKEAFGSCQLHVEWMAPSPPRGSGQARGNSGVFLMGRYEVQVLDNFQNTTYPDGQAGSVYGQGPPLVNACLPPGQWQSYDIVFHRPQFDQRGDCVRPATITLFHNGVLVQDHYELTGATAHKRRASYRKHPDKLPISLQDHGNPVRYRNIWIRPLED